MSDTENEVTDDVAKNGEKVESRALVACIASSRYAHVYMTIKVDGTGVPIPGEKEVYTTFPHGKKPVTYDNQSEAMKHFDNINAEATNTFIWSISAGFLALAVLTYLFFKMVF